MIEKWDRAFFTEHAALEAIHSNMVKNARAVAALQDEAHYLAKLAQHRFNQIKRGEWPQ